MKRQALTLFSLLATIIITIFLAPAHAAFAQVQAPIVFLDINSDLSPNSWAAANVVLKVPDVQLLEHAATLTFKVMLPTQLIDSESISIDETKGWDASPAVIAQNTDSNNSEGKNVTFNITFTRRANTPILPFTKLATVNFFITDNIDGKGSNLPPAFEYPLNIRLYDAYGYNNKGAFLGINTQNSQTNVVFTDYTVAPSEEFSIKTYPNPATDFLYISLLNDALTSIEIYDAQGKEISTYKCDNNKSNIKFDVTDLKTGNYYFVINTSNQNAIHKIISVQR